MGIQFDIDWYFILLLVTLLTNNQFDINIDINGHWYWFQFSDIVP
jgi:hypothetical protein